MADFFIWASKTLLSVRSYTLPVVQPKVQRRIGGQDSTMIWLILSSIILQITGIVSRTMGPPSPFLCFRL